MAACLLAMENAYLQCSNQVRMCIIALGKHLRDLPRAGDGRG